MEDFIIRSYTKKELALTYFPQSNPRTAVNHLMVWIRRCTPLWNELLQTGYKTTSKEFTPKQVGPLSNSWGSRRIAGVT